MTRGCRGAIGIHITHCGVREKCVIFAASGCNAENTISHTSIERIKQPLTLLDGCRRAGVYSTQSNIFSNVLGLGRLVMTVAFASEYPHENRADQLESLRRRMEAISGGRGAARAEELVSA